MIALEPSAPEAALAAMRAPFLAMDAQPIDVPVMQPLSLLLDLSGEAMRSRLFVVQADGIDEACLRPDFTIPLALAHMASGAGAATYRYEGKAFLVAAPGSGRAEEFLQIGLEVLGDDRPKARDAELLALAWQAASAGGRDDLWIALGDLSLFSAFVDALGLSPLLTARLKRAFQRPRSLKAELDRARSADPPPREGDHLAALLAKLPEEEAASALEELWAVAGVEPIGGRTAQEIVHRLAARARDRAAPRLNDAQADLIDRFLAIDETPAKALEAILALAKVAGADLSSQIADWRERLAILDAAGVPQAAMRLSPAFGRAFGYYDGFLFEVRSAALGDGEPVAAGGRYDSLLTRLKVQSGGSAGEAVRGAARIGAAGCMVRPWRAWAGGQS
jgi:ATP phosphoribosyltransferase regulatory subunit